MARKPITPALPERKKRNIFFFYSGVVIFLCGQILSYIISPIYAQQVETVGILLLLFFGSNLINLRLENSYFKYVFILFMVINLITIFRMGSPNYSKIKDYLFSDFRFWPCIVPISALFIKTTTFFKNTFKWIYWLGIIFLVIWAIFWRTFTNVPASEQFIWAFSSGCGFILLTWDYHSTKEKIVASLAILVALYMSTVFARRNIMLTNINFIVFGILSFFFLKKNSYAKKVIVLYIILIIAYGGVSYFMQNKNTRFKLITNRVSEDTRDYVFDMYFKDIRGKMIFGKGIDATYYCPMYSDDPNENMIEYRPLIECGYLQMILTGGILSLAVFLAILLPAIYLGLFRSNNSFSKACGILILLWLVDMFPYGLPNLSLRYIFVWICVGICYNKKTRLLSETEIKEFLSGQKKVLTRFKRIKIRKPNGANDTNSLVV